MVKTVKDRKTGNIILKIDKEKRKILYFVQKKSGQFKYLKKVIILGFDKLPSGFNRRGFGFSAGGLFILSELRDKYSNKFRLILKKEGESSITRTSGGMVKINFNHVEFTNLMRKLKDINTVKNRTSQIATRETLSKIFPKEFQYSGPSADAPFIPAHACPKKDGVQPYREPIATVVVKDTSNKTAYLPF